MNVSVSIFEVVKQKYVIYFFVIYWGNLATAFAIFLLHHHHQYIENKMNSSSHNPHLWSVSKNVRLSKKYVIDSQHHPFVQIKQLHPMSTTEHTLSYPKFLCTPPKTWIDFLEKLFFCLCQNPKLPGRNISKGQRTIISTRKERCNI